MLKRKPNNQLKEKTKRRKKNYPITYFPNCKGFYSNHHFSYINRGEYFQKFHDDKYGEFDSPYLSKTFSEDLCIFGQTLSDIKNWKLIYGKRLFSLYEDPTSQYFEPLSIHHVTLPEGTCKISFNFKDKVQKKGINFGYHEWTMVRLYDKKHSIDEAEFMFIFVPLHFHYGLYFQLLEKMMPNKDLFRILLNRLFYVHIAPCYMSLMYNSDFTERRNEFGWDFHFFDYIVKDSYLMRFYKSFF